MKPLRFLKHPTLIPGLFMLAGLFYLLEPFVTAWLEIVAPVFTRMLVFPVELIIFSLSPHHYPPDIAFGLVSLLYLVYFVRVARSPRSRREKNLAFLPLVILPLVWAAMSPLGYSSYSQKRLSSYVVGGWSRMMLAGGPAAIKAEALDLLESPEEYAFRDRLPSSDVPSSLRKLGDWVSVQRDSGLVMVVIKPIAGIADEFGYLIHTGRTPLSMPWYLEDSPSLRVWKLADDIYFFEQ